MTIRVQRYQIYLHNIQTRMPFRYGIAEMTAVPHLFIQLECEIDGQEAVGISADNLIPKWFTKDLETSYKDDLDDMRRVINQAGQFAIQAASADGVFDLWRQIYQAQQTWAVSQGYPALLWNFGVSLVERALIDAFCRAKGIPFAEVVRANTLDIDLASIHPELQEFAPADLLPELPLREINIRHTIGLSDAIAETDITPDQILQDGLPQSLEANIRAYGIRYFKIKVNGDVALDAERLCRIDSVLQACGVDDYFFTLDGNEQYKSVAEFRNFWEQISSQLACVPHMERLLIVEQPFHRQVALSEETRQDLTSWAERPLMIIDESDAEIDSLRSALECGYAGTSHKNCKGIFKSVANACLLAYLRKQNPQRRLILSGEDLANIGPVALLQDLTVMSLLGIEHVERNGHHYFPGLSMFPEPLQQQTLRAHSDLYHQLSNFPTLNIVAGRVAINSLLKSPFGYQQDISPDHWFQPEKSWNFESLQI
jgi:hypothetical protein